MPLELLTAAASAAPWCTNDNDNVAYAATMRATQIRVVTKPTHKQCFVWARSIAGAPLKPFRPCPGPYFPPSPIPLLPFVRWYRVCSTPLLCFCALTVVCALLSQSSWRGGELPC